MEKNRVERIYAKKRQKTSSDTGTGTAIMRSRGTSHQSGNTDNVIHQLVRSDSESYERVWRKIGTEADRWAAIEKDAAQRKRRAIQIDQEVAEAELQRAYLQRREPENIQAATLRTRAAKYELNKIQRLEAAGLASSSPNDPHYARVMNRGKPYYRQQICTWRADTGIQYGCQKDEKTTG